MQCSIAHCLQPYTTDRPLLSHVLMGTCAAAILCGLVPLLNPDEQLQSHRRWRRTMASTNS